MDRVIEDLAAYVLAPVPGGERARSAAHLSLRDALACALLALADETCRRLLEPPFASAGPVAVPGTRHRLDPLLGAFAIGTAVRWLDFNDTWLALEWGHPSDNLGAILAAAAAAGRTGRDVLEAMVQAYEVQGTLAGALALNRHGLDHVAYVRIASAGVSARLLGGGRAAVETALANAFLDGAPLRAYRHGPNVTWRKSWAAGDATSRGLRLAQLALADPTVPPAPLTAPGWGFQDALAGGAEIELGPLGSTVVENVLLKPWFPAEYHGQAAVEAALKLHAEVGARADAVAAVEVVTHESALRIIDKRGPLANPADRDHCLQYMVAVALLRGELTSDLYSDAAAADPRIDRLRELTAVIEDPEYSRAYLDPAERAVASRLRVTFGDGSATGWVEVRFPIGHPRRRAEGEPLVAAKLRSALEGTFGAARAADLAALLDDRERVEALPASDLLEALTP